MKLPRPIRKIIAVIKTLLSRARIAGLIYHTFRKWAPISKGLVLIDSFNGTDLIGNPYFIAKHLLESLKYPETGLVISGKAATFKALKRIDIHNHSKHVHIHSIRYCYYLATTEFLICDVTFPLYFSRRNEQRYLNTWHGTPLKALGRRMSDGQFVTVSNPQRNFLHATHLLAPNTHTENVLLKDYMIEPIWDGTILRGGYPRNDVFFKSGNELPKIPGSSDYNVAFMPTWRGKFADMEMKTNILLQEFESLLRFMEQKLPSNIRIWVRLHPLVREQLKLQGYAKILPMPSDREPYEFIAQCNALLTDYSSVMFDFALSKKPILLYIPDVEEYQTNRGFCLDFAEIPFPKVKKESDLVELLAELSHGDFSASASYEIFVKRFCPFDVGHSTEDLCVHFIKGCKRLEEHAVRPDHGKKNVLLFPGSFLNNGITTSLKNLIDLIDKDRYNLYLWIDQKHGETRAKEFFQNLDYRIRYIPSKNWLTGSLADVAHFLWRDILHKRFSLNDISLRSLWCGEYRRQFCNVHRDAIVHFSGYERRITLLMLCTSGRKIIYMHSDMYKETLSNRVYDSRALKLGYELADMIATVRRGAENAYSSKVMNIDSKIRYVPNTFSSSCLAMARKDLAESLELSIRATSLGTVLHALEKPHQFRFINLARFSPEKGQSRLIEAFEQVWKTASNCQLFIVGSHGIEYDAIFQRSRTSPAAGSIFVLIGSNNPYPLFSKMDACVLSSFYEGLPLVIFESFAFNIPVIATDIPGPSEFLQQKYGLVVDDSVKGLVDGMTAMLERKFSPKPYDLEAHNQEALENFYALLD